MVKKNPTNINANLGEKKYFSLADKKKNNVEYFISYFNKSEREMKNCYCHPLSDFL